MPAELACQVIRGTPNSRGTARLEERQCNRTGAPSIRGLRRAFTLLEVMIAIAILGIALLALLALHHQNLQGLIRSEEITRAAMLAQRLMTDAELARFPVLGTTNGDFQKLFPGQYPDYRWQEKVTQSALFPDVRKVTVRVFYGPKYSRNFDLVEYMHSPLPIALPIPNGANPGGLPNQAGMQPNGGPMPGVPPGMMPPGMMPQGMP